jgi:uncharacterized protein
VGRIRQFYESRFRNLARKLSQPPDEFSRELFLRAKAFSETQQLHGDLALALVHADSHRDAGETKDFPDKFLCDAGLGGLSRWLRAVGYESIWKPQLDDAAIIREAERIGATLITTDTMMMERGVLRDGLLPAVCVPSSLTCSEQLGVLLRELGLKQREPRCMTCGGELRRVAKENVASRIPPRTALWLDDYFVCAQCHQLFWHGTHWRKISHELDKLMSQSAGVHAMLR